jgi:glutathione S-transferase
VLHGRPYLASDDYTIADMAVFAYVHRADEAGIGLAAYPAVTDWIDRIRAQPGFLGTVHPYAIDPHAANELP